MLPRGNNQFNGRFDFFEWSAPYYETPKEVFKAIQDLQITGKTIKDIRVIGTVFGKGLISKVPFAVKACEPLQFVFEDDTTFEILPIGYGGARVATNTIPVDLVDGLNRSNFKSKEFYAEFIGRQLESADLYIKTTTNNQVCIYTIDDDEGIIEGRRLYQYRFGFGSSYEITLEQGFESYYDIIAEGDSGAEIRYQRAKEFISETNQVFICNGRDTGGTFWIVPIAGDSNREDPLPFFNNFGMSLDERCIDDYLAEFFYKYFDISVQKTNGYYPEGRTFFDWYGVNLYTFDSMNKMLADISKTADLLVNDYNNPELEKIKKRLPWHPDNDKQADELTETEIEELRKKGVPAAVDFYQRFVERMEKMMELPGRDIIFIAGL